MVKSPPVADFSLSCCSFFFVDKQAHLQVWIKRWLSCYASSSGNDPRSTPFEPRASSEVSRRPKSVPQPVFLIHATCQYQPIGRFKSDRSDYYLRLLRSFLFLYYFYEILLAVTPVWVLLFHGTIFLFSVRGCKWGRRLDVILKLIFICTWFLLFYRIRSSSRGLLFWRQVKTRRNCKRQPLKKLLFIHSTPQFV